MNLEHLKPGMIAVLGIPSDVNSCFMRGAAQAPVRIREVLHAGSMNLFSESGVVIGSDPRILDIGDMDMERGEDFLRPIEFAVADLLDRDVRVLSLGGDHAITYPILRAYHGKYEELTVLQLDAHPDLYDVYDGNRYSNACPFARIMEEGLVKRLVQAGIRTMNAHQREQAERFGVEVLEMGKGTGWVELDSPLYLSVDMDVLDPAFAPGVSHHEPGGLSTRDVITMIQRLRAAVVGADIVELNPARDPSGITAMAAAKLLKEIAARMVTSL